MNGHHLRAALALVTVLSAQRLLAESRGTAGPDPCWTYCNWGFVCCTYTDDGRNVCCSYDVSTCCGYTTTGGCLTRAC
jgi:hypothetical protein